MNREIKSAAVSKSHIYYWHDRLFKRGPDGEKVPNASPGDWWVQISVASKQSRIPLKTPNKEAAAALACKIYESLRANGWEQTKEKFPAIWPPKVQKVTSPTVGDYLAIVEKYGGIEPVTFKTYSRKFRRLVAGVMGIKGDAARFHHGEGSAQWRSRVDNVMIAQLSSADINRWRDQYVAAKRSDALKHRRAQATAQSILRNSKALFSRQMFKNLADANVELELPAELPLDGVEIGSPPKNRYTSMIDAEKLARTAHKELPKLDVELFKIFLLAFGVGLRRGEIDRLTWPQFNWSKNQINVMVTEYGGAKTEESLAGVDVDPAVMKLFKKYQAAATGEFVIESSVAPRPDANWHHYRCDCTFKRLNAWLRGKGVNTPNPIHTLRKEFGTLICQKFGIFAASEALRHSDIRLTREHYVDKRGRIHLEVGKMLK